MDITIIKGSHCYDHVRVTKFVDYFDTKGFSINFICWLRSKNNKDKSQKEKYIFYGGGYGSKFLVLFYPIWMLVLFFYLLFYKVKKDHYFFVIDFDSAFPMYLVSLLRNDFRYIYDIHDDFSKRYKIPNFLKKIIFFFDCKVRKKSYKVIHVDENRISAYDENYIVIYNSPKDFFKNYSYPVLSEEKIFCVSGLLSKQRGMESLIKFASAFPKYSFLVAGNSIDKYSDTFIKLPNVVYLGVLSQEDLFANIKDCHAIFSLYDPSVEINRLAASNKFYDGLMLGIPVITNYGLQISSLIEDNNLGFLVNFNYDQSWNKLASFSNSDFQYIGEQCRKLYEKKFDFNSNFIKKLNSIFGDESVQK